MKATKQDFFGWLAYLESQFPGIRDRILKRMPIKLGEESSGIDWGGLLSKAANVAEKIVPSYYNYKLQSKAVDAQIANAQQGRPPIDYEVLRTIAKTQQDFSPTVRHQVGMSDQDKNALLIGAAIIGGVIFLPKIMKG